MTGGEDADPADMVIVEPLEVGGDIFTIEKVGNVDAKSTIASAGGIEELAMTSTIVAGDEPAVMRKGH